MDNTETPTEQKAAEPAVVAPPATAVVEAKQIAHLICETANFLPPSRQSKTGKRALIRIIRSGESKNKNRWGREVLERAASKFNHAQVYYDHKDPGQRGYRDLAGEIVNPRMGYDGLIGEFEPLPGEEKLAQTIATKPHLVPFSVYAMVNAKRNEDGSNEIEEILEVESVDIVTRASAGGEVLEVLESDTTTSAEGQTAPASAEKEATVAEEQQASKVDAEAEAHKKRVSELEILAESQKTEIEKLRKDNELLTKEIGGLRREKAVEAFVASKRPDLTPAVERALRRALGTCTEHTAEVIEAAWTEIAALVADVKQSVAPPPAAGLPPKVDAAPAKEQAMAAPTPKYGQLIQTLLFGTDNK